MTIPLRMAHRLLRVLDGVGHRLIVLLGLRTFPAWLYRICCLTENVHDRLYPDGCTCCRRDSRG